MGGAWPERCGVGTTIQVVFHGSSLRAHPTFLAPVFSLQLALLGCITFQVPYLSEIEPQSECELDNNSDMRRDCLHVCLRLGTFVEDLSI